ncbi:amino acid adenylation domain-containing protein [Streptomyces sp. NPDC050617]|uniref:amino acid adenylation domain-containing protein n=1 Tax=Streptomyces sp. NPDC050617 TaxID=3154628 RepID=UPI00343055C3
MPVTTSWRRHLADEFARARPSPTAPSTVEARAIMTRNGWNGLCVPVDQGGLGLGWHEAGLLAKELGRALAPSDAEDTVVVAHHLARTAPASLPTVLRGETTAGLGFCPEEPDAPGVSYFCDNAPDLLLLLGTRARTLDIHRLPAQERISPSTRVVGVQLPADRPRQESPLGQTKAAALLLRSAHLLGLSLTALWGAVDRAGTRRQFGRPIGSYQALSFPLAGQRARLEGLRLAVDMQLLRLDDLPDRSSTPTGLEADAEGLLEATLSLARECVGHASQVFGAAGLAVDTIPATCYRQLLREESRTSTASPSTAPRSAASPPTAPRSTAPRSTALIAERHPAPTRQEPRALWDDGPPMARLASLFRERTLPSVNDTATSYPAGLCLHDLFERAALTYPDHPALLSSSGTLTYRELDARANRLAHLLRGQGTRPDAPVGICMERGRDAIVAALAVLKAGGACLFLDTGYPTERIAFMLRDSGAVAVLTHKRWLDRIPDLPVPVTALDQVRTVLDEQPNVAPPPLAAPRDLAYLIYTSGSTGTPKGVEVEHRNLTNRLYWDASEFELGPRDVVLQHTALGFDPSIWEIFAPLMSGAALAPVATGASDPRQLLRTMLTMGVTALTCVPSALDLLLEENDPALADVAGLRHIFCGGEELQPSLVRRLHRSGSQAVLHNCYGPSECSIDVTHWQCTAAEEQGEVPIGLPIGNVRVYLLDEKGEPVPAGRAGELYVAGAGVARGYRDRPELTAERFVPDPFTADTTARLYRTGDMARMREDGALVFLGRFDDQVKIAGHRVELGEIRSALEERPDVRTAVIRAADGRVNAYVVPADPETFDPDVLRSQLRGILPSHMVPSGIRAIADVPLTANGKVDYAALPPVSKNASKNASKSVSKSEGTAHRTAEESSGTEQRLVALAARVLGVEAMGISDDFFAAGGSSLHAARFITRVRNELGFQVDLATFLAAPTVKELAESCLNAAADTK